MGDGTRGKSFVMMDHKTIWLTAAIALCTLLRTASTSEPRVVCYYTNWSVYRPGTARFNPQNINPYLCTHLIYAFGGFTKDNALKPFDKYQDIEKGGYAKFTGLKTYNKNLKTLLAIGGWNEGSTRFSPMVASRERRKEFVKNAIKFLRQNRFDGLDLDWEYPAFRDGGKPKDRENYAKLVRELREEFEKESDKTGKPRLLLTMAVPAGIEYIQKGFDVSTLNKYLDWMNLLTYDYHSAFEPAVNHHAPLYPLEEPNEYSVDNELNIDYTIKFYLENGADRDKLVLGIPTYGRSYTLFNPDATEVGAPADGPGEQGDATREKGYLAYYEICESLKQKEKKRSVKSDDDSDEEDEEEEEEEKPWTVVYPNANAMGPVAYRGNQWVGYDDIDIVKKKAEYVAQNGLGGIMFWSIDNDDFRGACHNKPYPLIESAKEAYINKIGSTDNVVVTEKSTGSRRPRPKASTTRRPNTTARSESNKRKSSSSSTTPSWNIVTPEPPTTPDPGSDFKCTDEGFFPHPRDCKKYFWCLDSGPSNLGIVAHQFTCPSGLFFNKAADSCDFARNVLCKKPATTTKAPSTQKPTTTTTKATTEATTTTRRPIKLSTKSSISFRTTTTTTTTPEPVQEEEYEEEADESPDVDAEDPKVIKELIDLIKKVGGVEELERHLHLENSAGDATTKAPFNTKLYQKVLERTRPNKVTNNNSSNGLYSRRGPQNAGLTHDTESDKSSSRKDRPQYTTINRSRPSSTTEEPLEDEDTVEEPAVPEVSNRARAVDAGSRVATTAKPLQYVNIRRGRPTSDTADDTASRNALFERVEPYVPVSETQNLDIVSARKENMPEYVTIRRQRPTTQETTTAQYETTLEEEFETLLEKEISNPSSQTQYTSIVRARSTTLPPTDLTESPEPTTVLSVQISSLLNSPAPDDIPKNIVVESLEATETSEPPTTTTTTTTTTTSAPVRRLVQRRRGTTTTTPTTPTTSAQAPKDRRKNFIRRTTKATSAPETTEPTATEAGVDTTTTKYLRRGINKFKTQTRKNFKEGDEKNGGKNDTQTQPSLTAPKRNERPQSRNFVRRRIGGATANATSSTTSSSPTTTVSTTTRRPFRVASRRRPLPTTTTTTLSLTSTSRTTTADAVTTLNTNVTSSEESLQDIEDRESLEDPGLRPRSQQAKKTIKIQRRPLTSLKEFDQNPSATNEDSKGQTKEPPGKDDDKRRQSKKYSASFKQNQFEEMLRQKSKSQEESDSTTLSTTADDYSAETAVAVAAHQLASAPLPVPENYDEEQRTTKKSTQKTYKTTHSFGYTDTDYPAEYNTGTEINKNLRHSSTPGPYSTTPIYRPSTYQDIEDEPYNPKFTVIPINGFSSGLSKTSGYSTSPGYATTSRLPFQSTDRSSGYLSSFAISPSLGPSTARYLDTSNKYVAVPVNEFGYTSGLSQEPSYFTREYLLESPVTKTYDEEYQYLSPVMPQSTTRRTLPKKTVFRKISTTQRPTPAPVLSSTTVKPRRVQKKPFEKVLKQEIPNRTYRPNNDYDYYDDSQEQLAGKYGDGAKVILHGKGAIECLDIGNFPYPTSCKKFIQCARMESGSIVGWEYVCPKGLSFDPVGAICNWSAGLGCNE